MIASGPRLGVLASMVALSVVGCHLLLPMQSSPPGSDRASDGPARPPETSGLVDRPAGREQTDLRRDSKKTGPRERGTETAPVVGDGSICGLCPSGQVCCACSRCRDNGQCYDPTVCTRCCEEER